MGEGEQTAGEHGRAADRSATVRHGRGEAGRKERADRERAHHQRAGDRGKAPYDDEEEHAEEEDADEGAERERERACRPPSHHGAGDGARRERRQRGADGGESCTVATAAISAIGAWMMNTARQSSSWVTAPPSTGPSAAPATPAAAHQRGGAVRVAEEGHEHTERAGDERGATHSLRRRGRR